MTKIFKIIFSNFTYKLIALLLAIIFWYIVQSEQVLEINRKVRVQLIAPDGYIVKGGNVHYKDAMLRGPRALLNHFPMDPITAQIKLFTDKPQNIRTRVDREYIRGWNDRIKITIYDAYISAYLDRRFEKELMVKQNILGLPKEGYVIEKIIISPEKIMASGAASDLQRIDSISTEVIDINNIASSKSFDSNLLVGDLTMRVSPRKVHVDISIGDKKINRSFSNIPIEIESASSPVKIRPLYVSVIIQGTPEKINSIKAGDIQAFLNVKDLGPGSHERKVQIKIPHDSVLVETSPESVIIEINGKKKSL